MATSVSNLRQVRSSEELTRATLNIPTEEKDEKPTSLESTAIGTRQMALRLQDGQFSQNNVSLRIKEIHIYSPDHIEILDGHHKTIRIEKEFIRFPHFTNQAQFEGYLSSVYWNVIHLGQDRYRISSHVRGLGGGNRIAAEVSNWNEFNEYEKSRLTQLLGNKTISENGATPSEALKSMLKKVFYWCYDSGRRQRSKNYGITPYPNDKEYQAWFVNLPQVNEITLQQDILILLKAGANPYLCIEQAYNPYESAYEPKGSKYNSQYEDTMTTWLIETARSEGATMNDTILSQAANCEGYPRQHLIRDWVTHHVDLEEEGFEDTLLSFFFYTRGKDKSIEAQMLKLIKGTKYEDLLFTKTLELDQRWSLPNLALELVTNGYVGKDLNTTTMFVINIFLLDKGKHSPIILKALFDRGANPPGLNEILERALGQSDISLALFLLERGVIPREINRILDQALGLKVDPVFLPRVKKNDTLARVLIDSGAKPMDADAALSQNENELPLVKRLLECGANPKKVEVGKFCELHVRTGKNYDYYSKQPHEEFMGYLERRRISFEDLKSVLKFNVNVNGTFYEPHYISRTPLEYCLRNDEIELVELLTNAGAIKTTAMLLDAIDRANAGKYFQLLMQAEGEIDLNAVTTKLTESLTKLCQQNIWTDENIQRLAFLLQYGASYKKLASRVYRILPNAIQQILNNEFKDEEGFIKLVRSMRDKVVLNLSSNQYQKLEQKGVLPKFEALMEQILQEAFIIIGLYQENEDEVVVLQDAFSQFLAKKLDNLLGKTSLSFSGNELNEENIKKFIAKDIVVWLSEDRRKIGLDLEKEKRYEEKKQFILSQFESQRRLLGEQKELMCEQLKASGRAEKLSEQQLSALKAVNINLGKIHSVQINDWK